MGHHGGEQRQQAGLIEWNMHTAVCGLCAISPVPHTASPIGSLTFLITTPSKGVIMMHYNATWAPPHRRKPRLGHSLYAQATRPPTAAAAGGSSSSSIPSWDTAALEAAAAIASATPGGRRRGSSTAGTESSAREVEISYGLLVAADGADSTVRQCMQKAKVCWAGGRGGEENNRVSRLMLLLEISYAVKTRAPQRLAQLQ